MQIYFHGMTKVLKCIVSRCKTKIATFFPRYWHFQQLIFPKCLSLLLLLSLSLIPLQTMSRQKVILKTKGKLNFDRRCRAGSFNIAKLISIANRSFFNKRFLFTSYKSLVRPKRGVGGEGGGQGGFSMKEKRKYSLIIESLFQPFLCKTDFRFIYQTRIALFLAR